jgi:hypothetical protein
MQPSGLHWQRSTSSGTAARAMRFHHEVWAGGQVERKVPNGGDRSRCFDKTLQTTNLWLDEADMRLALGLGISLAPPILISSSPLPILHYSGP